MLEEELYHKVWDEFCYSADVLHFKKWKAGNAKISLFGIVEDGTCLEENLMYHNILNIL